ncbi:MAG: sulfatase, partial [Terriglobales bacterium]
MLFLRLALIVTLTSAAAIAQRPPDIFLITLDTLRADRVGCYGYAKAQTPALDRLAREGVRFAHAFTPSPITNSSHTSILTGLNPSVHGVTDFGVPLGATHVTLAQVLKQRGYATAAFIGAVILDSNSLAPGLDRGFDFYFNFPDDLPKTAPRWGRVERRGLDVVKQATKWLTTHRTGPRFLWVHLYDPHDPYEAPAPFTNPQNPYDGEVAYTDHAVSQFLGFLEKNGWYKDALIIAVGDHGEGLGEHGEDTHGIFLYDSTLRVPLLFKLPAGLDIGLVSTVTDDQANTTEIFPTILDLLGIPAPPGLQGRSLRLHWSERSEFAPSDTLAETDYPLRFGWAPLRAVRSGSFKYIEAPRPEFYDLNQDPDENQNRYEPWNPDVQKLRGILADARSKAPQHPASAGSVDPATIEHLRQLGYLGTDPGSTSVSEPSLLPDP